jgi:hypothetical protein
MTKTKLFTLLLASLFLSGCGTTYTFDGKRYASSEEMVAAQARLEADALASIQPLVQPLVTRSLVFALPSEKALHKQSVENFERINGRSIGLGEDIIMTKLVNSNWKNMHATFDGIKRRGIYPSVRYVELDSVFSDLQPTTTEDIFAFSGAANGGELQVFYSTARSGKQIFAYDRSGADMVARTRSFIEAISVFALRN